jgi:DNA mismatch repair protein MutL
MPKIRVLSDILASQVAAGEVVERPASVVKELVENSIDAGSREIRVDVDRGGSALIRVTDDGCGMSREDALLSLERHATSKLRTSGDLAAILTLGFRGEAVPSIASVSRFRMLTREKESVAGTEILVDGGKVRDVRDAGGAPGTTIEAKSLFYNMPARKKFMRAESTESAHIEHQVRLHALAAPTVRFRLRRDEREVFDLPPVAKAVDRVRQIVGNDLGRELISLPVARGNGVSVEGFVLPASHARKGRRHQFVFLNGRPVEDSIISRALSEGFRGAIADGQHPAAWLWIELEPHLVDVNVHPAKREVRFHRPLDVKDAILEAVLSGLRPAVVQPVLKDPASDLERPAVEIDAPAIPPVSKPAWSSRIKQVQPSFPDFRAAEPPLAVEVSVPEAPPVLANEHRPAFRVMSLLHDRYALLQSDDGLVIFDPKAAKERIYYERLLRQQEGELKTQGFLVPVLLELDPRDMDLILRERISLSEIGLEVEAFGGNTLQIWSLPACLPVENPQRLIGDFLDELLHESSPGKRFAYDRLARLFAKRSAMFIQPKLSEIDPLLSELFACELPYCTADGRPTLSELSLKELARRFGNSR